ncbi:hypothetical protein N0V83_007715 [Neocucurbitaria cava]|uniref:Uncharacterized protein n=1 Tax=Neocucurbitaria cava TaxID=798079 RepID=A0A9W8Y467_9PLEO|nr:hypothetical protein N0V83_007715 [Neocucurbitaria cava]
MSAKLEKQAATHASVLHNVKRQVFQSVPQLPSDISLVGKTALVTGSNVGLGLECARYFLKLRPSRLVIAVRSIEKGETAAKSLRTEFPDAKIEVWQLDMESYRSVQAFAARCEKELDRLHVAVLNAALAKIKLERVKDGRQREVTLQVNYLSTALLAILLLPIMKPTSYSPEPARLTIITSDASLGEKLQDPGQTSLLDSLDQPQRYDGFTQYARSKLLITMFAARLAETVDPDDVIINSCNPGATKGTEFMREGSWVLKALFALFFSLVGRTAVDAARIYVHAALVLGKESHGSYTDWLVRAWPVMMYGEQNRKIQKKLWDETMKELSFAKVNEVLKKN